MHITFNFSISAEQPNEIVDALASAYTFAHDASEAQESRRCSQFAESLRAMSAAAAQAGAKDAADLFGAAAAACKEVG